MVINPSSVVNGGFAQSVDEVAMEVHYWDYNILVIYILIILINVCGIVKYAFQAYVLTLLIMVTNFFAISCKLLMTLKKFNE